MIADACTRAMTLGGHHEWLQHAAIQLRCGSDPLWQSMCAEWADMTKKDDVQYIIDAVADAIH